MPLLNNAIHLGSRLDQTTLESIADFICGDDLDKFPIYRSSSFLTRFFQSIGIDVTHDGSTRKWWVLEVLKACSPSDTEKVILRLVDLKEYKGSREQLRLAVRSMNEILSMEDFSIEFNGVKPQIVQAKPITFDVSDFNQTKDIENEKDFLGKQFSDDIQIADLGFDSIITQFLQERIDEIQASPKHKTPLATIFLLGSTLEGILLATALKDQSLFTKASNAPKSKDKTVLKIYDWKLYSLIDVAYEVKYLNQDVKKFSHVLRDFRNYIHPFAQMSHGFQPDQRTVDICWQVFKAVFEQLKDKVKQN